MGEAFLYGNGEQNPLNFRVIGSLVQPAAPKENTIWVNTDTTITSWVFAPEAPTNPEGGMIFFKTDKTSPVGFNALRKNEITVLPTSAQQYIGGQWKNMEAHAYIGGTWVQFSWTRVYLYKPGQKEVFSAVGWRAFNVFGCNAKQPDLWHNDANVTANIGGSGGETGVVYLNKPIDLSNFKTIHASVKLNNTAVSTANIIGVWKSIGQGFYTENKIASKGLNPGANDVDVDVSNLNGEYYIGFGLRKDANSGLYTITDLYMA